VKSRLALVVACCLALSACSLSMPKIWPFYKKPKPGPEAVTELTLVNADGTPASYPQYWVRNTLVIDLSGIGGQGSVAARLPEESTWPVRVALRVQPGSVGQLDIQAEERNVLPVTTEGAKPVDIELATSLYTPKTAAIYIAWSPVPVFMDTAPVAPAEPAFVSPTEAPKPAGEAAGEEPAPTASDIVPPSEVAPAQPAPGTR
jgi:hypothetical protein